MWRVEQTAILPDDLEQKWNVVNEYSIVSAFNKEWQWK